MSSNKLLVIGFGITPISPDEMNGDIDDSTFNLGEHISSDIMLVEDSDEKVLVIYDGKSKEFDDMFETYEYVCDCVSKNKAFSKLNKDVIVALYTTLFDGEVDEDDEELLEEELGCELDIKQDDLEAGSEYGNCLYAYMLTDSYNGDVEIKDSTLIISDEKVEFNDIIDHESRKYEEETIVVITSKALK